MACRDMQLSWLGSVLRLADVTQQLNSKNGDTRSDFSSGSLPLMVSRLLLVKTWRSPDIRAVRFRVRDRSG
jgi:hypothetical protein